jgi:hypothetical protein
MKHTITNNQAVDISAKTLEIASEALEDHRLTTAEEREWLRTVAIPKLGAWKFTLCGAENAYVDDLIASARMLLSGRVARGTFVEFYEDTVSDFYGDVLAYENRNGREEATTQQFFDIPLK